MTGNASKTRTGVGMPAMLKLEAFGLYVMAAFGEVPYWVGSSLTSLTWRDVDVRVLLPDERYESEGYGRPSQPQTNLKWVAQVFAFCALGRDMTGLPIDFQIQQMTKANEDYTGPRSALGLAFAPNPLPIVKRTTDG